MTVHLLGRHSWDHPGGAIVMNDAAVSVDSDGYSSLPNPPQDATNEDASLYFELLRLRYEHRSRPDLHSGPVPRDFGWCSISCLCLDCRMTDFAIVQNPRDVTNYSGLS